MGTKGRKARRSRGRRTKRRNRGFATLAKKVEKLWVHGEIDKPPKHVIYSNQGIGGATIPNLSTTALINATPQSFVLGLPLQRGNTVQSRLGDYVFTSRIKLKCRTTFGTAINGIFATMWMLIYQKSTNAGVVPPASFSALNFCDDYFGTGNPESNTLPNWNNRDFSTRYQILRKGKFDYHEYIAGASESINWGIDIRFKTPMKTSYILNTNGNEQDIDYGKFILMMYTDNVNGTGGTGILTYIEGIQWFRDQS